MKRTLAALGLAAAALMSTAGMAQAAPAGDFETMGGCIGNICGSVMNESNNHLWAIKDWGDTGPKPDSRWMYLAPGDETPRGEDWDGFWVPCNASGRIAAWVPPGFWQWRDFSLSAGQYKKISTYEDAHVRHQSC
ncbi:hypothetical protein ACIA8G_15800 [Lentzea sp. NPDC051213]|uniref:hypothetical protein n=1 Tax=Lentzea sp. NPDC051213 TaxID=3364126 RepID=UPI0037952C59